jgi:YD repeat-containing protein
MKWRGLTAKEVRTVNSTNVTTSYTYDKNGNRATIRYPSNVTYTYTFDFADRPITISGGSIGVSGALYQPFGPLAFWNYGNSRSETRSYDQRYQLNSQVVSGSILNRNYGHDGAGKLT